MNQLWERKDTTRAVGPHRWSSLQPVDRVDIVVSLTRRSETGPKAFRKPSKTKEAIHPGFRPRRGIGRRPPSNKLTLCFYCQPGNGHHVRPQPPTTVQRSAKQIAVCRHSRRVRCARTPPLSPRFSARFERAAVSCSDHRLTNDRSRRRVR